MERVQPEDLLHLVQVLELVADRLDRVDSAAESLRHSECDEEFRPAADSWPLLVEQHQRRAQQARVSGVGRRGQDLCGREQPGAVCRVEQEALE